MTSTPEHLAQSPNIKDDLKSNANEEIQSKHQKASPLQILRIGPWYKEHDYLGSGWQEPAIWRAAFIEGVASVSLVFISGQVTATLMSYKTNQVGAYIAISNTALLSLFIYATAPASGGFINPLITLSAVLTGFIQLSRGVLYIAAQTIGGAIAGGLLIGVWGYEKAASLFGGGCFFDPSEILPIQVYLIELIASFILLYLSYGVGLDPQQGVFYGPFLGPLLVGASLGLVTFSTSGIAPGFAGAQMNPARCFAYGIARQDLSADQWIWWIAPAFGALFLAAVYRAAPPHHVKKYEERANIATTPLPV